MIQLKRPFAVRFKHRWNLSPVWETFWTQTADQAIARAKTLYSDISGKIEVQIIKVAPLAMNEAIMPADIRKHNEAQKKSHPPAEATPFRPVGHYLKQSPQPTIGLIPF